MSGEVAPRATSLGPTPSLFVLVYFLVFLVSFCFWKENPVLPLKNLHFSMSPFVSS